MKKEDKWTKTICTKLGKYSKDFGKNINFSVQVKVPYNFYILEYELQNNELKCKEGTEICDGYKTDLLVYEKKNDVIKPRVIIESKYKDINTHDAITYSEKARCHKVVTPYIRYGIMAGDRKNKSLPGLLLKHGSNFDFMYSFSKENPSDEEFKEFVELINREIETSKNLEKIYTTKSKDSTIIYMHRDNIYKENKNSKNKEKK